MEKSYKQLSYCHPQVSNRPVERGSVAECVVRYSISVYNFFTEEKLCLFPVHISHLFFEYIALISLHAVILVTVGQPFINDMNCLPKSTQNQKSSVQEPRELPTFLVKWNLITDIN